jgi:hypothetical protein
MNVRRMLYGGLIYCLLAYGIVVWGQSAKTLTRRIFTLQESAVRYPVGLKERESCRDSFRQLKILTIYSLYLQETILYAKEKGKCTDKQIHTYNTRNNNDYLFIHLHSMAGRPMDIEIVNDNKTGHINYMNTN